MIDMLENVLLFAALLSAGVALTIAVLIVLIKVFEFADEHDIY